MALSTAHSPFPSWLGRSSRAIPCPANDRSASVRASVSSRRLALMRRQPGQRTGQGRIVEGGMSALGTPGLNSVFLGVLCNFYWDSMLADNTAGFQFISRERARRGGNHVHTKKQFIMNGTADGFGKSQTITTGRFNLEAQIGEWIRPIHMQAVLCDAGEAADNGLDRDGI